MLSREGEIFITQGQDFRWSYLSDGPHSEFHISISRELLCFEVLLLFQRQPEPFPSTSYQGVLQLCQLEAVPKELWPERITWKANVTSPVSRMPAQFTYNLRTRLSVSLTKHCSVHIVALWLSCPPLHFAWGPSIYLCLTLSQVQGREPFQQLCFPAPGHRRLALCRISPIAPWASPT